MVEFKTIKSPAEGIIIEKKSKFIANIFPVQSKEEAEEKIKDIKRHFSDARHNCYAYSIIEKDLKITKSSDDGEPSGTAGMPILKVITQNNLQNILIVVTRYFGGILLGTGGLARAYTEASIEAISNSEIVYKQPGYEIELEIAYTDLDYLKYYVEQKGGRIGSINYADNIKIVVEVASEIKEELINENSKIGNKIQRICSINKKCIEKNIDK